MTFHYVSFLHHYGLLVFVYCYLHSHLYKWRYNVTFEPVIHPSLKFIIFFGFLLDDS
eukprot:UN12690